nr:PREDICTED: DNA polymerase nu-like isoform X1 [Lepisosteus oculatus]
MELRTLPEGSLSVSAQKILAAIREQYTDRTAKARQSRQIAERGSERSQGSLRRESRSGFWEQTVPVSGCWGGAIRGKESLLAAHFPSGVNQGKPAACYKERARENRAQTGLPGRAQTAQLGARHAESRGAEAVRPLQADVLRMKRFEQESNWGSGCCQTDSLESVEPSGTNASQISDLKPDRMRYSASLGTEDTFSPSGDQRHSLQQPDLESRRLAVERKSSAPVSLEGHKMENQFERSQSTEIPLPCGKAVSSGISLKRKRMTLSDNAKKPGKWEPSLDRGSSEKPETGKEKVGTASAGLKSPVAVTSEAGVCDASRLSQEERALVLRETAQASVIVLTMVYQDGTAQLNAEQKSCPPVSGVLVLLKSELDAMESEGCSAGLPGSEGSGCKVIFLKLEQRPAWAQQGYRQDRFSKEMLLCILGSAQDVICFKAKDLLCTALQYFGKEISWKQVALCRILDPQIAAWLLDPADTASCFWDLVAKRCKTRAAVKPCAGAREPNVSGSLLVLYRLMMDLRASLQEQGLWKLFCSVELRLTTVLAVMEIHRIHVDKDALEKTSKILGMKLKQLEQEAHQAAGQQFLVSSSSQLRVVLFEKLRLHERCENKKLPKTVLRQQQSTSEATLMQLQDLHPLPKIILEYRQVHKIKSAYVDGILSCMSKFPSRNPETHWLLGRFALVVVPACVCPAIE